jgi:hypothetical protein
MEKTMASTPLSYRADFKTPAPQDFAASTVRRQCRRDREADLSIVRTVIGALLVSIAFSATAIAQERAIPGTRLNEDTSQVLSPLARDIERQLGAARDIEHHQSLEQSRVNARSTSDIQQRQTTRDVQLSGQRLKKGARS